jgi:N-acetylmuramoyl-L-alanine amidase
VSETRLPIRTLLLALAILPAHAQTSTPSLHKPRPKAAQSAVNPNQILLDPAHGGPDSGATLAPDSVEKDATVAFAARLRTILAARGFTILLTHDSSADQPTPDQRAETANRSRAAACILLHASNGGHGVHLFTSSLTPISPLSASFEGIAPAVLPWGTAQATSIQQSLRLAFELSDAFHAARVPLVVGHVSVPPIDSMTCPAVAIELAPADNPDNPDSPTPASDPDYQQRIATAIADALNSWRGKLLTEAAAAAQPAPATAKPATPPPVRKPKPVVPPVETPPDAPPPPPSGAKTVVPQ